MPMPSGNTACDDALSRLAADFAAARRCSVDADCNFVDDNLAIRPHDDTQGGVVEFACSDATPRLVVANGDYVESHRDQLATDLANAAGCGVRALATSCDAQATTAPGSRAACAAGVCRKAR